MVNGMKQRVEVFPDMEMTRVTLLILCLSGLGAVGLGMIALVRIVLPIWIKPATTRA